MPLVSTSSRKYTWSVHHHANTPGQYLITQIHLGNTSSRRYNWSVPHHADKPGKYLITQIHLVSTLSRKYAWSVPHLVDTSGQYLISRYTWSVSHLVSSYHTHSMMPTSSFWRQYLNECTCMYSVRSLHFGLILSWYSINQQPNSISNDIHWLSHIRSVQDNCSMIFNFDCSGWLQANAAYHHPTLGIEINLVVSNIVIVDDEVVSC